MFPCTLWMHLSLSVLLLSEGGKYFKFTFCVCLDHVSLTSLRLGHKRSCLNSVNYIRYGTWFSPVHTFFQVILENLHLFWTPWACGKWTELAYPFSTLDELTLLWSFCHLLIPPFSIPWPPQHTLCLLLQCLCQATFSLFPTIVVRIRLSKEIELLGNR